MSYRIPYNRAPYLGEEAGLVVEAMERRRLAGNNRFTKECEGWFERELGTKRALMTPSCTAALELAALLLDVGPGDEVIMPSFTFVSTANAFVLRGATPVFVDILPDTLNIDPAAVEAAMTPRTRAIVAVHYAGVVCDMAPLQALAAHHQVALVEDAAQALGSALADQPAGTFGDLAAFSFHETKNVTAGGEGGMLCINDERLVERAEILREKGTNRTQFFQGKVDKYRWIDLGSSYLASELQAAYLLAQLRRLDHITAHRLSLWSRYRQALLPVERAGRARLPRPPKDRRHNGHIFFLLCRDRHDRDELMGELKGAGICAVFHYVPLHSAPAGRRFGRFHGQDQVTTTASERLLRLPLYHGLPPEHLDEVAMRVRRFYDLP